MDGRLGIGALALTLLVSLAGCGGGGGAGSLAPQDSAARSTGSAPATASTDSSAEPVRMSLADGNQTDPAMARLAGGGEVVAWVSQPGDSGADSRIVLQRYDEQGVAVGDALDAAAPVSAIVARPALASLAGGGFVVAWIEGDSTAGAYPGGPEPQVNFFVRRYTADGQPLGAAQQVSTAASHYFTQAALAPLAGGGFAVGWLVDRSYASDPLRQPQGWLRVYDASGVATDPVALRATGSGPQPALSLAPRADGGFLVAWQQWLDPNHAGLYLRAFDAAAQPLAAEARVDAGEQPWPNAPALAMLADGRHVLAWDTGGTNDPAGRVRVRLLDGDGAPLASPVAASSGALAWSSAPKVAALDDGGFATTWLAASLDARLFSRELRGQRFDFQGQPAGAAFNLGSSNVDALVPGAACGCHAVAAVRGGALVAAMQAYSPSTAWDVWVGRH